jgi:hypothetical protein
VNSKPEKRVKKTLIWRRIFSGFRIVKHGMQRGEEKGKEV